MHGWWSLVIVVKDFDRGGGLAAGQLRRMP